LILARYAEQGISGYTLAKEIEKTGDKPSSGKIYPFLHQLRESELIEELDVEDETDRSRIVYKMTSKGRNMVEELMERMTSILDQHLGDMLENCRSCGVKIFESSVEGVDQNGKEAIYCCSHCKKDFYHKYGITA
jgi:DNA-binding PadR family transcriptional regulator